MAKGQKTGGRKRGSSNKVNSAVKDILLDIAERNQGNIESWILAIDNPKDRVTAMLDLLEFVRPKMARIEHTGSVTLSHELALADLESDGSEGT
jgi:hypothetical protein